MADIKLTCKDCGSSFDFTERDQDFYKEKGFSDPVRCASCRRKKREQREQGGGGRYR